MSDEIISVENLGKRYTLFHKGQTSGGGLRHLLNDAFTAPMRWLKGNAAAEPQVSSYEDFWALKDVSFSIRRGDVLGIIGRNGAGKSTLLKILSRITEPTEGRIRIRGRVASLLEVGTGFHPELTGRENIFLNGAILGMSRREIKEKFDEIVAFAEIDRFVDTPVKRYSSGMYVRLAFAVAAHLEPEILVIDEVLAVGDAQFQKKCLGKMQEVSNSQGRTVLFVSHQLGAIRRLCKSALLLQSGHTDGITTVERALALYTQDVRETPSTIDLSGIKRAASLAGGSKLARISVEPEYITYGRPLKITCRIESSRRVVGSVLGVAFDSLDGSRVMTLDSDNSGAEVTIEPGLNEITMNLARNPLTPGMYVCAASLFSGKTIIDAVTSFATWEVHPGENDHGFAGCRPDLKVETALIDEAVPA